MFAYALKFITLQFVEHSIIASDYILDTYGVPQMIWI